MIRRALAIVCSLWLAGPAFAQSAGPLPMVPVPGPAASTPFASTTGTALRAPVDRAADVINPRDYCSVCGDGSSHTVSSVLGVSTLSGLAAYTANGKTPFSFINSYPYGVLFNLTPEVNGVATDTTLTFKTTATLGSKIMSTAGKAGGTSVIQISDQYVTPDKTSIPSGATVTGTNVANGTTLTTGLSKVFLTQWTASISTPLLAGGITNGQYLTFVYPIPSGAYALPIQWASGITQGDTITDTGGCIAAGTQVETANPEVMSITLSLATIAQCPANDVFTFIPSWLSHVSVGATVTGPTGAIPGGTTVTDVNLLTGVVSLSAPLTGNIYANAPMFQAGGWNLPTPVTFWRAYTNGEAAALEMDRLAIQAAVNLANGGITSGIGGDVKLPSGSSWLADGPIILPITYPSTILKDAATVGVGGDDGGWAAAQITAKSDFGPAQAVISCGDPTATVSNARGLYNGTSGYFCPGMLHNVRLEPAGYVFPGYGLRPRMNAVPIAMDGIKQGPRLYWSKVLVQGFRCGTLVVMDHTSLYSSTLTKNFNGFCLDEQQPTIWGDWLLEGIENFGNAFANFDIAGSNWISGELVKNYMAFAPYNIACEPSFTPVNCVQGTNNERPNMESVGCGEIKDLGIRLGFHAVGASRNVVSYHERNAHHSKSILVLPAGSSCEWDAYYDLRVVGDMQFENVWQEDFPVVAGAYGYVMRVTRLDQFIPFGLGGVTIDGTGLWEMIQDAYANGEDMVAGQYGQAGGFFANNGPQLVTLRGPGFIARPIPFTDASATDLPIGTQVCWGTSIISGALNTVNFCGRTAGQAIAGVSAQPWTTNPQTSKLTPIIYIGGSRVPFLTSTNATAGGLYKVGATPGSADTATGATDGQTVGMSYQASGSTLTYGRPLWPGQN